MPYLHLRLFYNGQAFHKHASYLQHPWIPISHLRDSLCSPVRKQRIWFHRDLRWCWSDGKRSAAIRLLRSWCRHHSSQRSDHLFHCMRQGIHRGWYQSHRSSHLQSKQHSDYDALCTRFCGKSWNLRFQLHRYWSYAGSSSYHHPHSISTILHRRIRTVSWRKRSCWSASPGWFHRYRSSEQKREQKPVHHSCLR